MKKQGLIICLTVLFCLGILVPSTIAQNTVIRQTTIITLNHHASCLEEMVHIDLLDCTGHIPVKKTFAFSQSEWNIISNKINSIKSSSISTKESLQQQINVLKEYHMLSDDVTVDSLSQKWLQKLSSQSYLNKIHNAAQRLELNNTIINFICSIDFEFTDGIHAVLGLNSFINYIGFNIASVHKGNASSGIVTRGLLSQSVPAGEYVGFMFGFLGYWLGEKTSTGIYSSVTATGFTVITAWVPLSLP